MEDVLEVYHRQYEDNEVLVCLDETSKQQVRETRPPRPPRPGAVQAYDHEYQRNGVSNLFMVFAPLEGWRRVEVTERRTKVDWARQVKQLVDQDYPDKDRIVLVMDNLGLATQKTLTCWSRAQLTITRLIRFIHGVPMGRQTAGRSAPMWSPLTVVRHLLTQARPVD